MVPGEGQLLEDTGDFENVSGFYVLYQLPTRIQNLESR